MNNMRFKISAVITVFCAALLYSERKTVGFDAALSTGFPIYGNTSLVSKQNLSEPSRIIIGLDGDVTVKLGNPLRLIFGADTLFDLSWKGKNTNNHIDYAFFGGLKIYPNIAGLNTSISYALGRRTDTITNDSDDAVVLSSAWGNGFRFSIEYDFLYGKTWKCAPIAGMYYRMMPRGGNNYDNIIAVYAGITF